MEENIKVRVIVPFNDIENNNEYTPTQRVMWLTYKRTMELLNKGLIKIMEIRRSDNGE